ncbi:MAG: prepilin-type N-terminal cleavage/methylation domain-containing protein [Planctomycetes bacterium]|nr:prepilin-type N-terminal cleavage/methylation domain-containing protein [Planctomycetota bacterium]
MSSAARGFTYVELLAAVVVVGIGVCGAMAGIQSGLDLSQSAAALEQARHFADAFRQYTTSLAFSDPQVSQSFGPEEVSFSDFDDLDDLDDLVQSPPVDASGTVMGTDFSHWSLLVTVRSVDEDTLEPVADGTTNLLQIYLKIEKAGRRVGEYRWLCANR